MFDIGWSEMAIIALVALVVLGPKQLPQAMRSFAQFSKKMRRYAQEFRSGVDAIVREAELEDAKKALDTVRAANPKTAIKKLIDPSGEMTEEVKSVEAAAKQGDAKGAPKQIAKPAVDPTGPAAAPPAPTGAPVEAPAEASIEAPAAAGAEPPVPMARRVSQPLQVAPPHSVRPPAPPAEVSEADPAAAKEEGAPRAADLRKQA
jgi:sec-independent protein translocase protein TatB